MNIIQVSHVETANCEKKKSNYLPMLWETEILKTKVQI